MVWITTFKTTEKIIAIGNYTLYELTAAV
ncbi:MAG: hypothetical protein ACMUEM_04070 [Flavobacteriales bacterium AspAUS03]